MRLTEEIKSLLKGKELLEKFEKQLKLLDSLHNSIKSLQKSIDKTNNSFKELLTILSKEKLKQK